MTAQQAMVGVRAPGFSLPCTRVPGSGKQQVELSDYLDRWLVLMFYPRDFSMVCPTELTALSARIEEFRRRDCDILGVSTDSVATHDRWITTAKAQGGLGGLHFPLAADEDGAVASAYGVFAQRQRVALRGLFMIDPNGVLQYQVVHNLSVGRRADEVLRVLDGLQTGGLCPADWERESPTLDPTQSLGPGSVLGPFRIDAELGRGTFGVVYRAYDSLLERTVAIKLLRQDGSTPSDALLREARAAAALIHPHICTVFSVDTSEGVPLIVMEYLDGQPLSKMLEGGPLPAAQALRVGRHVSEAMAAAHAQGIVHGDLKPANIMVTTANIAKVLDFGLARKDQPVQRTDETALWQAETVSGLAGTPSYMAPEQVRGQKPAPASDVFALGLILFEVVTGKRALEGKNIMDVLRKTESIDPERFAAQVPAPFDAVLRQALLTDVGRREITMEAIASQLGAER
jgi:alkyl hydroperoxide reductase subunit AhpC/predicted Ser/Thr protein kinase